MFRAGPAKLFTAMSTLVTGSSGQIGSRCRSMLVGPVTCLDARPSEGVICCDLRQPVSPAQQAELAGVTQVIHLAGSRSDPPFSAAAAWSATEANAIGTANLLAALPPTVEHVVLVSSISVYGPSARGSKLSETGLLQPRSAYGASKANAERIARLWGDRTGTPVTIARVAQVYGEGTDPNNGLYRMLATAIAREPIVLSCRDRMRRDYIHLDDVARILGELVARPGNRVVNVGSGEGIELIALARLVAEICNAPPPRAEGGDGEDLVLDTSVLTSLGLAPQISLEQGARAEHARLVARS